LRKVRVLILGLNFAPEPTGVGRYTADFAAWLSERGHEVRVITAPPYYPEWRVGAGYTAAAWRRESIGQVGVLGHVPVGGVGAVGRWPAAATATSQA
jgi:colanic acid biosynthesis glycosyl transferase WcaI